MKVSILVLDYNRPEESELCLVSLRQNCHFDNEIVFLSNGGYQDYTFQFYKNGLIDKLILRKENSGCGLGTRELFNNFDLVSEYVIYCQCDQFLNRAIEADEVAEWVKIIEDENNTIKYVDLAGNQGHGVYSERAHFINKYFYNKIPNTIGGPGKHSAEVWTEESVQKYFKENNYSFYTVSPIPFIDNGKVSRREYPCGGELVQFTDTKQVFITRPIKQKVDFPNIKLTDEEWISILNGEWENGTVPELQKKDSFVVWEAPYALNK